MEFLLLIAIATWRYTVPQAQIKPNLTFLIRGCFGSPCGQAVGVQLALWCIFVEHVRLVQSPLTGSQTETQQFLWTRTDLAVKVVVVSSGRHAAVGETRHLPWIGKELVLSVSWNVTLSE